MLFIMIITTAFNKLKKINIEYVNIRRTYMSVDNLHGLDNDNNENNKNNEVNVEEVRQETGFGISNFESTNYADFRQEPIQSGAGLTAENDNGIQNTSLTHDTDFEYFAQSTEATYSDDNNISGNSAESYEDSSLAGKSANHTDIQFEKTDYDGSYMQQDRAENVSHDGSYMQQDRAENVSHYGSYMQQDRAESVSHDSSYAQQSSTAHTDAQGSSYKRQNEAAKQETVKSRKKGSTFKRIVGISAAALLFGTIAGGTMFGVNNLATSLMETEEESTELSKKVPEVSSVELKEASTAVTTANNSSSALADVSPIAESAMPSVVAIKGTTSVETYSWFGEGQTYDTPSSGSGIIIGKNDTELLVVTNNHVVEDTKDLSVVFIDNEEVKASVKGRDSENDIAIIAVKLEDIKSETLEKIAVARMGDSDELKVGQGVVAIGNALGYGQSVTVGYVSAIDREVTTKDSSIKNLLQTDAAINPGNSGGALLNMSGEVIGINTAKYASTEVEGMGYAIPISKVKDIISELSSKETRSDKVDENNQGYLGIQGKNIGEDVAQAYDMPRGIYVYKIVENSLAADSDLREKDIITKVDSQSVRNMEELKDILSYYKSGEKVKLTVQRLKDSEYEEKEIEITLSDRSALQ